MAGKIQFQMLKSPACWLIVACWVFAASCSFDSSLNEVSCDVEGSRSQGRLCQDGHWVLTPETDAALDANSSVDLPDKDAQLQDISQLADALASDTRDGDDTTAPKDVADDPIKDTASDAREDADTGDDADTDEELDADTGEDADTNDDLDADTGEDADSGSDADASDTDEDPDVYEDPGVGCTPGSIRECIPDPGAISCVTSKISVCSDAGVWGECIEDYDSNDCSLSSCSEERCDMNNPNKICHQGVCCEPRTGEEYCADNNYECGEIKVKASDNCGVKIAKFKCGECAGYDRCSDEHLCEPKTCTKNKDCKPSGSCEDGFCRAAD